eukprot:scaffold10879_cov45-Attheya_sp.AAC.1
MHTGRCVPEPLKPRQYFVTHHAPHTAQRGTHSLDISDRKETSNQDPPYYHAWYYHFYVRHYIGGEHNALRRHTVIQ